MVMMRYKLHIQRAVVEILGCNFPILSPVDSAENNFWSPLPIVGKMATVKNTIPIPPIQCVMLRQKRMEWGSASMFVKILAPVVVNPDIVSKNAWATLDVLPPIRKGSIPMMEKMIHVEEMMR